MILKAAQVFFGAVLLVFLVFVLWMNLTPGHFQLTGCGDQCEMKYLPNNDGGGSIMCVRTGSSCLGLWLLSGVFSLVDFNK